MQLVSYVVTLSMLACLVTVHSYDNSYPHLDYDNNNIAVQCNTTDSEYILLYRYHGNGVYNI